MEKVKLFRRGRLVGLITPNFYRPEVRESSCVWEQVELQKIG